LTVNCGQSNGVTGSVTLGQSSQSGASGVGTIGNVVVTNGTLIVMTPGSLADGANLAIGGSWTSASLTTGSPGGPGQTRQPPATLGQGNDTGGGSTGSTPITDNGLNEFEEIEGAGAAAFAALTTLRYSAAQPPSTLSKAQTMQVGSDYLSIVVAAYAGNGYTWQGLEESTVDAAIEQLLQSQGKSAAANDNHWTPTYNNPWGLHGITLDNYILKFFATHDIS
jgi:hypothetical protein